MTERNLDGVDVGVETALMDAFAIDDIEERYAHQSEEERAANPLISPPREKKEKIIKVMDGVVQKASEGIIESSTRQEYAR